MPGACELRLLDRTPSQAAQCVAEWAASVLASVGRVVGSPASATLGDFLTSFVLAFCGLIAVVAPQAPSESSAAHTGDPWRVQPLSFRTTRSQSTCEPSIGLIWMGRLSSTSLADRERDTLSSLRITG